MMLITRKLGITDYQTTLAAMQAFTNNRQDHTDDELWLTEHPSVYTLGLNRKNIRLPDNAIPVVNVDRGGKITYHGLGQAVIYCLLDLNRRQLKVRALVDIIEDSIVSLLAQYQLVASTQANAPGVYIGTKKIASVGLRLKKSYCYHGLSLNIDMDLTPFQAIDPCGYAGLEMTQTKDWNIQESSQSMGESLLEILKKQLIT
ncbi:MAG: lipoyl(octanoyl) transferase LipB [Methylophilaceae bacterium]|nr:lipoyl(octanoyl) transferase LipB [Methylophilaceae bacterium]MDG1821411.1 lipoyl(octanoyl) transferase LipB [Methylophilaceae bacterium]MDG2293596.1 lipoyl(octanoyl) transferase LipB [Methylophilaceae bacterium]